MPNDKFLYQVMIFRHWSICYIGNFLKMSQMNKK